MVNGTSTTRNSSFQNFYGQVEKLSKSLNKIIAGLSGSDPEGVWHDIKDLYNYGGPIFKEYVIGGFKEAYNILDTSLKEAKETRSVRPLISGVCNALSSIYKGFTSFFSRFPDLSNFIVTAIQLTLIHTLVAFVPVLIVAEVPIMFVSKLVLPHFAKLTLSNKDFVAEIKSAQELQKATEELHKIYPQMRDIEKLAKSAILIQKHHNIPPNDLLSLGLTNAQIHKLADTKLDSLQLIEFVRSARSFQNAFQDYDPHFHATNMQNSILLELSKSDYKENKELQSNISEMFTNYMGNFDRNVSNKFTDQFNVYAAAHNKLQDDLKNFSFRQLNQEGIHVALITSRTATNLNSTFLSSQMEKLLKNPIFKEFILDKPNMKDKEPLNISSKPKSRKTELSQERWVKRIIAGKEAEIKISK